MTFGVMFGFTRPASATTFNATPSPSSSYAIIIALAAIGFDSAVCCGCPRSSSWVRWWRARSRMSPG